MQADKKKIDSSFYKIFIVYKASLNYIKVISDFFFVLLWANQNIAS